MTYNFSEYKKDSLTKPRDLAWSNWMKFEKVGNKVQGYIADAFFRPAEGIYKDQRGITLRQEDGKFINVGIKRLPFVLDKTDNMRLGDPLTVELVEEKATDKGNPTKVFAFYGASLPENANNPTVLELDNESHAGGGAKAPAATDKEFDAMGTDTTKEPFPSGQGATGMATA